MAAPATPFIVSPLTQRAAFYRTLAQLLSAGAPVPTALESAVGHLPGHRAAAALDALRTSIRRGEAVSAALAATGQFPPEDLRLLAIAERSGHADTMLFDLAAFSEELVALRRTMLSGLALPTVYLAITALIAPLPALLAGGSAAAYLMASVGFLAIVGLVIGGAIVGFRRAPGTLLDRFLRPLPLLGATWVELDYWRMTRNLALLSRTSLGVIESVRLCATTCQSPRLAAALRHAADEAEARGAPLSPSLLASGEFPLELVALWQTGERSGQLEETFRRLATLFGERSQHRLREVARWAPRIVYFVVVLYMAFQILRLAGRYIHVLDGV
jgi:type II secretory pathway component PulF